MFCFTLFSVSIRNKFQSVREFLIGKWLSNNMKRKNSCLKDQFDALCQFISEQNVKKSKMILLSSFADFNGTVGTTKSLIKPVETFSPFQNTFLLLLKSPISIKLFLEQTIFRFACFFLVCVAFFRVLLPNKWKG